VSEHGHARLEPGALLDLARKLVADAAEANVAEGVEVFRLGDLLLLTRRVGELVALADDDDREVLAPAVAPLEVGTRLLDRQRLLGDETAVSKPKV
jgi:hypothetical protein